MKNLNSYINEALIKNHVESNMYGCVDLDLPSGTLWATCNIGAKQPWEVGDYFAWGETESKTEFTTYNYKFGVGQYKTKYKAPSLSNKIFSLDNEDDVAYVESKGKYVIPSQVQLNELINNTDKNYNANMNGVNGVLFISKKNKQHTMFIPCGGRFLPDEGLQERNSECNIWGANTCKNDNQAIQLYYALDDSNVVAFEGCRWYGLNVRPVLNKK